MAVKCEQVRLFNDFAITETMVLLVRVQPEFYLQLKCYKQRETLDFVLPSGPLFTNLYNIKLPWLFMAYLFEVTNKSGRKINLTKERWAHISKKHPEVGELELLEQTLKNPDKVVNYNFDETVHYYYKFFKHKKSPKQYLLVQYLRK